MQKRLSIRAFLEITLVSLTLRVRTVFFEFFKKQPNSLYWFAAEQQTSTSRRQKFDLFYPKFTSEFNERSLKATGRGQKIAKTKTAHKTSYMWHSGSKG